MQKVLVVEDDATVASLIRRVLEDEGFMVVAAADLEGAWSELLAEDPDAALVDLRLTWSESGWDLVERIRTNEHFHDLPVVIVTGAAGSETVDRARDAGCEYVMKPFSPAALIDRLRFAMRAAGRSPQLRAWTVTLLLHGSTVTGNVHAPAELDRFSDAWESVVRDARIYLPVTEATIDDGKGGHHTSRAPVVEIRKADVQAAFANE